MQHLTEEVTKRLVSRLPESKAYYSLSDLHDFQIPTFMINRIELELRRNLADSVVPPATDWANMDSANVKTSWENFLKAIHEQVRLPRSYANSVFEVCVADILELLSQPRKHMIEVLFDGEKELKFEELRQAANLITVYHYLPDALIKYMHRKQLPSITKERAQQILVLVDEKITSAYTPLNWAQLIDPFYTLLGEAIETELLRQFFADKGKTRWADFFDKEHDDITRTRFIEVLSMPELDGIEAYVPEFGREYKDKTSETRSYEFKTTFTNESIHAKETDNLEEDSRKEIEHQSEESTPFARTHHNESETISEKTTSELPDLKNSDPSSKLNNELEVDEKPSLQNTSSEKAQDLNNKPLKAVTNYVFNDETMEFEKVTEYVSIDSIEQESSSSETIQYSNSHSSSEFSQQKPETFFSEQEKSDVKSEKSESPILKSYDPYADILNSTNSEDRSDSTQPKAKNFEDLEDDDVPIYKRLENKSTSDSTEKPLVEQIKHEEDVPFWKRFMPLDPPKKQEIKQEVDPSELFDFLAENEEIYITELFADVQNNYVEAIQDLANYEYWEQASKYIKEEIFRVNRISPLDDAALDFISHLQEWFTNKQEG